jgi:hypothetical protein
MYDAAQNTGGGRSRHGIGSGDFMSEDLAGYLVKS